MDSLLDKLIRLTPKNTTIEHHPTVFLNVDYFPLIKEIAKDDTIELDDIPNRFIRKLVGVQRYVNDPDYKDVLFDTYLNAPTILMTFNILLRHRKRGRTVKAALRHILDYIGKNTVVFWEIRVLEWYMSIRPIKGIHSIRTIIRWLHVCPQSPKEEAIMGCLTNAHAFDGSLIPNSVHQLELLKIAPGVYDFKSIDGEQIETLANYTPEQDKFWVQIERYILALDYHNDRLLIDEYEQSFKHPHLKDILLNFNLKALKA